MSDRNTEFPNKVVSLDTVRHQRQAEQLLLDIVLGKQAVAQLQKKLGSGRKP